MGRASVGQCGADLPRRLLGLRPPAPREQIMTGPNQSQRVHSPCRDSGPSLGMLFSPTKMRCTVRSSRKPSMADVVSVMSGATAAILWP